MEKLRHEVYEQMWVQASLQLQERSKATSEKIAWKKYPSALFPCGRYDEATPFTTEYYHHTSGLWDCYLWGCIASTPPWKKQMSTLRSCVIL